MGKNTVAVIGGGLAGLTCALILARNGHKVVLVEKSPCLGLTVRGFMREGVYFDTGLHYTGGLGEQGIVRRYLRYIGMETLPTTAFDNACFDEIRFADTGQTVRLPIGYDQMTAALYEAFPDEHGAITSYMRSARIDFNSASLLNFFLDAQNGGQAPKVKTSLAQFLNETTRNEYLKTTLSIHSLLYGVSPGETSFTQHAYVAASYFDSVHTFTGGGRALVQAFEQRLAEEGVTVILGNGARRIICQERKKMTRLELADETMIEVDACICTTHPAALADMAAEDFRPAYTQHLRSLEDTTSAYMLFAVADKTPDCLKGRNLFLCHNADLARAFTKEASPEDGPLYIASSPQPAGSEKCGIVVIAPGNFEAMLPWQGSSPGSRPEGYKAFKEKTGQRIRRALVALCPELAAVRFVEYATPLTMRNYLHTPRGGLYGCKHSITQFNPLPVTRISNLWLAGQSIIAPGLLGAMISAFLACGFFVGHKTLQKGVSCD
jgi:all-trans-retinol 13,14-reductase